MDGRSLGSNKAWSFLGASLLVPGRLQLHIHRWILVQDCILIQFFYSKAIFGLYVSVSK
jgi:hypothetical protein